MRRNEPQKFNFNLSQKLTILGLSFATLLTSSTSILAQTFDKPNAKLNVERKSGNCPTSMGLWVMSLPFEGGADHIVVADTRPFAESAKLIKSTQKLVEYEAPLQAKYASCVGQASLYMYSFQFRNRKVYFRVNLERIDSNLKIVNKQLVRGRPYVAWQAVE